MPKPPQLTPGPTTTPRKAQSAPPTPLKKPPTDKKLAQVVTTSFQLAKTLSPLKALVMGKSSVPQISTKLKGSESKNIPRSTESAKDITQYSHTDKNDNLKNTITPEKSATHVSPKNSEPVSFQKEALETVCKKDDDITEANSEQPKAISNAPSQTDSKDDSKPTGPLVVKFKGLAPTTQTECAIVASSDDSTSNQFDTQKVCKLKLM